MWLWHLNLVSDICLFRTLCAWYVYPASCFLICFLSIKSTRLQFISAIIHNFTRWNISCRPLSSLHPSTVTCLFSLFDLLLHLLVFIAASLLTVSRHFQFQRPIFMFTMMVLHVFLLEEMTQKVLRKKHPNVCSSFFPHLIGLFNNICIFSLYSATPISSSIALPTHPSSGY